MNDSRNDHDRLLLDIFHDDWDKGAAAQLPRMAAAHARQRRRTKHVLTAATACAALLGLSVVAFNSRMQSTPVAAASLPQPKMAQAYEIISDAELLAVLRDRSVVMIKQPDGTNEFALVGQ